MGAWLLILAAFFVFLLGVTLRKIITVVFVYMYMQFQRSLLCIWFISHRGIPLFCIMIMNRVSLRARYQTNWWTVRRTLPCCFTDNLCCCYIVIVVILLLHYAVFLMLKVKMLLQWRKGPELKGGISCGINFRAWYIERVLFTVCQSSTVKWKVKRFLQITSLSKSANYLHNILLEFSHNEILNIHVLPHFPPRVKLP